ncbi:hypothetical protein [Hespellia stercorisuis]|uniref:Uncharacterized protein n=1 Tax=Hespellia stercorisuis DSM 15480 TaxID=1121950 RepID=A0A1M6W859_9FIRM|nr:hypothetical protein [Hespellia stercorisuis]SHK89819.1 hypothetical protein SAMN02745243_03958 [Hespellia stercorisuis DSM 15480]
MTEIKDFISDEYPLTITDILERAKEEYGIVTDFYDPANIRHIQRYMSENNKPYVLVKGKGKTRYYRWCDVDAYFNDCKVERYYRKVAGKDLTYKTNKEIQFEQEQEFEAFREERRKLLKKAGLTEDDGNFLDVDRFGLKEYVTADELVILKKKGMHLRADLSDEDKETLTLYETFLRQSESEEREIERLFQQTKLEIMVTALFNERFSLNEERLMKDIKNYVRGGEYSAMQSIDKKPVGSQTMEVRRSYLRLKKKKGYVQRNQKQ